MIIGCQVLRSRNKKLFYMPDLLKKEFGPPAPPKGKTFGGTCMLSNLVAVEAAVTGQDEMHVFERIMPRLPSCKITGHTVKQIVGALNREMAEFGTLKDPDAVIRAKRTTEKLTYLDACVSVMSGRPAIVVVSDIVAGVFDSEIKAHRDGVVATSPHGRILRGRGWHSYVMVGIDTDEYAILRDSRSIYGFKGYLKVDTALLRHCVKQSRGCFFRMNIDLKAVHPDAKQMLKAMPPAATWLNDGVQ